MRTLLIITAALWVVSLLVTVWAIATAEKVPPGEDIYDL